MNETKKEILKEIERLVERYPEQRVGQIIYNYICADCRCNDPFFIEDNQMLEKLKKVNK